MRLFSESKSPSLQLMLVLTMNGYMCFLIAANSLTKGDNFVTSCLLSLSTRSFQKGLFL